MQHTVTGHLAAPPRGASRARTRHLGLVAAFAALALWQQPATAEGMTLAGVSLPAQRGALALQGAGLLRKGLVFNVYVGALYLASPNHADHVLSAVPKRLDIHYLRTIPKARMVGVAEESLKANISADAYLAITPEIAQLHAAYRDGAKGSCASLVYLPGQGLTYLYDDEEILTIRNETFANIYFSVWLGDPPSSKTMKQALLASNDGNEP